MDIAQLKHWAILASICFGLTGCGGPPSLRKTAYTVDDANVQTFLPLGKSAAPETVRVSVNAGGEYASVFIIKAEDEADAREKMTFKEYKGTGKKPDFIVKMRAENNPQVEALLEPQQSYFVLLIRVAKQPKCKVEITVVPE